MTGKANGISANNQTPAPQPIAGTPTPNIPPPVLVDSVNQVIVTNGDAANTPPSPLVSTNVTPSLARRKSEALASKCSEDAFLNADFAAFLNDSGLEVDSPSVTPTALIIKNLSAMGFYLPISLFQPSSLQENELSEAQILKLEAQILKLKADVEKLNNPELPIYDPSMATLYFEKITVFTQSLAQKKQDRFLEKRIKESELKITTAKENITQQKAIWQQAWDKISLWALLTNRDERNRYLGIRRNCKEAINIEKTAITKEKKVIKESNKQQKQLNKAKKVVSKSIIKINANIAKQNKAALNKASTKTQTPSPTVPTAPLRPQLRLLSEEEEKAEAREQAEIEREKALGVASNELDRAYRDDFYALIQIKTEDLALSAESKQELNKKIMAVRDLNISVYDLEVAAEALSDEIKQAKANPQTTKQKLLSLETKGKNFVFDKDEALRALKKELDLSKVYLNRLEEMQEREQTEEEHERFKAQLLKDIDTFNPDELFLTSAEKNHFKTSQADAKATEKEINRISDLIQDIQIKQNAVSLTSPRQSQLTEDHNQLKEQMLLDIGKRDQELKTVESFINTDIRRQKFLDELFNTNVYSLNLSQLNQEELKGLQKELFDKKISLPQKTRKLLTLIRKQNNPRLNLSELAYITMEVEKLKEDIYKSLNEMVSLTDKAEIIKRSEF